MPQPGSGLTLDPAQLSLTINQRVVYNRLRAQGTPDNVARMVAISVAKRALAKAAWSEEDHPRDEAGRWSDSPTSGAKAASAEQKAAAVSAYGNFSYRDINEKAVAYDTKGDGSKEDKRLRGHVEALSQAIHDDHLEKDTKLYRGFRLPEGMKEGDVLQPHGFSSASTSKAVANGFAQAASKDGGHERVVATILAPKGMPALDREKFGGATTNKSEKEFIFDHRQSFRIVKDNGLNAKGIRQIVIEPVASHSLAKSEGLTVPAGVRAACKRGLEIAPEYGGQGLTEGAKARARSMAAGNSVSPDQVRRMHSFFSRHDSYAKQSSPPSPGYVSWMLWGGDAGKSWAASQSQRLEKTASRARAAQAAAHARAEICKAEERQTGYHKAFAEAAKAILPQGVIDTLHKRARAIAGGQGKASAAAAARADAEDMGEMLEKAEGQKPMGAAFSHARASGKKQDHKSRKRRANAYLRSQGHEPIGKAAPCVEEMRQEQFVDGPAKKKRKDDRVGVEMATRIVKAEDVGWKKLVWSVVYEPDVVDAHGDYMDAETIEKAAHGAMRNGIYINREHAGDPLGAHVVESYVAPCEMTFDQGGDQVTVSKGSWVMGMQIESEDVWADVLNGTFTGFSLEGSAAVPQAA